MQDTIRLLDEAINWLGANYGTFRFFVERDVTWTLQSFFARRIRELNLPLVVGSSDPSMADIALFHEGAIALAIHVKYEPANLRTVSWKNDVVQAARQFKKAAQRGKLKAAAIVVIDEGRQFRDQSETLENGEWLDSPQGPSIFRFLADGQTSPTHKDRLVEIVRAVADAHKASLDERKNKETADLCRPDFLWWRLVHDTLIQGNSDGGVRAEQIEELYAQLQYDVFAQLTSEERFGYVNRLLIDTGIRMARKKSLWLIQNFAVIQGMGGPVPAKERLLACSGRVGKIRFLKQTFSGIGDQGARSIMMAAYHDEFRNSIAIDEPLNRITTELGMTFRSYVEQEEFLLSVASASGLEGWELDRLLSEHYKAFSIEGCSGLMRMQAAK